MHWCCLGVVIAASTVAPAPPLLTMRIITAGLRLIRGRCCTACLLVSYLIVGYVCRGSCGSGSVKPSCRSSIFYLERFLLNLHIKPQEAFLRSGLLNGVLFDLALYLFGHEYCKRGGIDQPYRRCVNGWKHRYTLVYCLFHRQIKRGTPKTFAQGSTDDGVDHGNYLRGRVRFRGSAYISKELYDGVRYNGRITGDLLAHGFLQHGQ